MNPLDFRQEILFASSDKRISNQISKAEKKVTLNIIERLP